MPDYSSFRQTKNLTNSDIIRVVRTRFPKFSKVQNSMINNPWNGVCLLPEAEQLLVKEFGEGPGLTISRAKPRRTHENKNKPKRLYLRLSDETYSQVNSLVEKMCFASMQDFLEAAVQQMLEKYGGAA